MSTNIEFKYINPELYRHPLERDAKAKLEKIPGFSVVLEYMQEGWSGKAEHQIEIASMVRVAPGVYPALDLLWQDIQGRFGFSGIPLHISFENPRPWSIQGGNDSPSVIVDCRWLNTLPEKEMAALLAMQAGAIRLGNATYLAAADYLRWMVDFSGIAGGPAALVTWGMETWRRYASFSSDRAAALSMGDAEAVTALLDRISGAGGNAWGGVTQPDQLRIQGIEAMSFTKDWSNSRWRRFIMAMTRHNNAGLVRRLDIQDWFEKGAPTEILSGKMTEPQAPDEKATAGVSGAVSGDPGLAYWGEFAGDSGDGDSCDKESRCPMMELMGMAEKGWNTFWKAGGNFLKTFQEK